MARYLPKKKSSPKTKLAKMNAAREAKRKREAAGLTEDVTQPNSDQSRFFKNMYPGVENALFPPGYFGAENNSSDMEVDGEAMKAIIGDMIGIMVSNVIEAVIDIAVAKHDAIINHAKTRVTTIDAKTIVHAETQALAKAKEKVKKTAPPVTHCCAKCAEAAETGVGRRLTVSQFNTLDKEAQFSEMKLHGYPGDQQTSKSKMLGEFKKYFVGPKSKPYRLTEIPATEEDSDEEYAKTPSQYEPTSADQIPFFSLPDRKGINYFPWYHDVNGITRRSRPDPMTKPLPADLPALPDFQTMENDLRLAWCVAFSLILKNNSLSFASYHRQASTISGLPGSTYTRILKRSEYSAAKSVLLVLLVRLVDEKLMVAHRIVLEKYATGSY
mmetsp:Transcript_852/g.1075  ORF Transcript_852/g.1075 Transcript_852/m.1075 type:complete len:384 (-) Transcript_852:1414-2565(-)